MPTLPDHIVLLGACAFLAGLVRGFSGFGLSAVLVASGAFFISPKTLIPAAQVLEIVASVSVLKSVWRDVNWQWLKPMAAGYALSVPLGVAALAYGPTQWLRIGGCIVILVASGCLLAKVRPPVRDGFTLRFGTGLCAGFLAGASSLGGMLASVMLFAVDLSPKALRATLVILFFLSACYSQIWGTFHGVVSTHTFTLAAWLALPLLAGVALGTRGFSVVSPEQFKRYVLMVLMALAVAGILSVAFAP